MEHNPRSYLLDIAREEAASKEAELHSLRNSLRYRVGGWVLEALPPGRRTLVVLWRIINLYLVRLRGRATAEIDAANLVLPVEALQTKTLMFGATLPEKAGKVDGVWSTENAKLMALRLDSGSAANTLILRRPSSVVVRRIARAKLQGTKIIWWPEISADLNPALVAHIRAQADECRDELAE